MRPQLFAVWSPELLGYDFGPHHPMSPVRLELTVRLARDMGVLQDPGVLVADPGMAQDELLCTVHDEGYVSAVRTASAHGTRDDGRGLGTQDNPVFAGMHEAAARIVAGSVAGALAVWRGQAGHAVNVAGGMHHAGRGRAAGFCVYNDAAVAIRALLADGAQRVAYLDFDAHHGDGVQEAFWDDPRVLTCSVHESGMTLFPGTGYPSEIGGAGAEGTTVNVAVPAGTGDAGWLRAVHAVVPPVVRAFAPQVLVTQHGCDAHRGDPLANLQLTVDALRAAMELSHDLAHRSAGGRWLALGGGGYAVVGVVPRAWTHLLAIAAHQPLPPASAVPQQWRHDVGARWGRTAPLLMTDGGDGAYRPWSAGYDPADPVDRAVVATRKAAFWHLDLDPLYD